MDIQRTLDEASRTDTQIEFLLARAYRDAAEVLSAEEIEECRREAAVMTERELNALLADLAA